MRWTAHDGAGPAICGHRGASAVEPENTLASFGAAVERGATWVEFDVRPTGDGALVIHHDPDTSSHQHIATSTRRDLSTSIPVLGELVAAHPGLGLDLEMKTDDIGRSTEDFVDLVIGEIDRHLGKRTDRLMVTSFDEHALAYFRQQRDDIATGLLFHKRSGTWAIETALALGHVAIVPWHPLVTPELVAQAHAADLAVATWTVNDAEEIARVAAAGVDMIIGDDPAVIQSNLPAA